jgi:hypothetical protein
MACLTIRCANEERSQYFDEQEIRGVIVVFVQEECLGFGEGCLFKERSGVSVGLSESGDEYSSDEGIALSCLHAYQSRGWFQHVARTL